MDTHVNRHKNHIYRKMLIMNVHHIYTYIYMHKMKKKIYETKIIIIAKIITRNFLFSLFPI